MVVNSGYSLQILYILIPIFMIVNKSRNVKLFSTGKLSPKIQYFLSALTVVIVSLVCFSFKNLLDYKIVALLLLMTVSVVAMLFEILPVLLAAVLSAIIWNFFFIPPLYTFEIGNAEDVLMFLLYFLIALVNAVLTFKIREAEKKARFKEEKENELRLYNTLLNSLSHELRTPIATILGSVDMLKGNVPKVSAENQMELLKEIGIAADRLDRQVENILNMSRLESGTLRPVTDWTDMNELVHRVIYKVFPCNTHQLVFQQNENLPLFKIDAGLTEEIVYNLLQNAVQYTPSGSRIDIEVKHESESCVIIISDNGNGFPATEIPLAFDKFYRLPNTKTGGSGLGLSIVKGFAEAQKGRVTLGNNTTGGATFTVEIPAETSYLNNLKNE
ncbi:MAG TPA: ATP-binding protein [Hanamia sp.]|nr:ATP-binding protein [Hanamia sp.]